MKPNVIEQAFISTGTDKSTTHGYHDHYATMFNRVSIESILEVGVSRGSSLAAWRLLFPKAQLTGVDVTNRKFRKDLLKFADATVFIGDSTDKGFTRGLSPHDMIIDDGSHFYLDIIKTFSNLHDKFNQVYVIEDAMYNIDLIVEGIRSLGFNKVEVLPSNLKRVPVDVMFLQTGQYSNLKKVDKEVIDLHMIVVYR